MTHRGALILIEGLDRTGKSTQCTLLHETLKSSKGIESKLLKFPDRTTPIGKLINSYLVNKEFSLSDESAHLLFSANRWELHSEITEALEKGVIVIMDRYVFSGVAYSSAKGLDLQWCLAPDINLPRPDLTIFLDLKHDADLTDREGYGEERYEVKSFQAKVKNQFEKFHDSNWRVLDVDGLSIPQVQSLVWETAKPFVEGLDTDVQLITPDLV